MSFDDATLMAFVDGELDAGRRAEVEAALAASPELAARLERQERLKRRLQQAYAPVLDEPLPERLLAAARAAGGAEAASLAEARRRRRPAMAPAWAAMAACLVVGLVAGAGLTALRPQPWLRSGAQGLEASGALGRALDHQLASAAAPGSVRIGLSFLSTEGAYCRTFTSTRRLAGLACRDAAGWRVRLLQATGAADQASYRMAASETPTQVLQAAQSIMAAAPLDARAEAAARARGWRK